MDDRKRKDQELYDAWKQSGDKQALGQLVSQLSPLIYSEVQRASGSLPNTALSAEAKKWAIKAIQNYDPTRGASISTHVVSYLPKIRRLNYKFQNVVRLPENLQLRFFDYSTAIANLTEKHNREPSEAELANELGWSKAAVMKYKNSLFADLVESSSLRPMETTQFNQNKILYEHILTQLSSDEKFILDNSKEMSSPDLAKKLNVNINRLNYLKSKLVKKIQGIKQEIGMY